MDQILLYFYLFYYFADVIMVIQNQLTRQHSLMTVATANIDVEQKTTAWWFPTMQIY